MKDIQIYKQPTLKKKMAIDFCAELLSGSIDSGIGVGGGNVDKKGMHDPQAKDGHGNGKPPATLGSKCRL